MLPAATPPEQPAGSTGPPPAPINPYLAFDSSLRIAADVVGRSVSDQQTATALAGRGAAGTYTVVVAPDSGGPLLKVSVEAPDAASAGRTMDLLVKEISTRLQALQVAAGAPQSSWINSSEVSRVPAAASYKKAIQIVGLLFAAGLAMTVGLAIMVEKRARRRRAAAGLAPGGSSRRPATGQPHGNRPPGQPVAGRRVDGTPATADATVTVDMPIVPEMPAVDTDTMHIHRPAPVTANGLDASGPGAAAGPAAGAGTGGGAGAGPSQPRR